MNKLINNRVLQILLLCLTIAGLGSCKKYLDQEPENALTRDEFFKTEADAGGQGKITGGPAPKDTDGDGIPDAWEKTKGLNPAKAADGNTHQLSKEYTNLEVYINSLVK